MMLPEPPDLGRPRWRLLLTALGVTIVAGLILGVPGAGDLSRTLGDTDDAMRMVLARGLLHGQGWWDQHQMRLQPPVGVYMHWSRLLDGGIAAMAWTFGRFTDAARAEWLTRLIWPMLWIFPSALGVMVLADRLGERRDGRTPGAIPICVLLLLADLVLYIQYHPGRVDHHDVQMSCCFLALAGGVQRGPGIKGAVLAGAATAFGLAIGLEALLFEAAIGGAIALRFVFDQTQARPLRAYGLTLAGAALACFCVQTPPWRWSLSACDALAFNSAAAILVAGLAVAAIAQWTRGRPALIRFIALGVAAVTVAATYVGLDPRCLTGPFADVDPAIKSFWLAHVQEMRPWPVLFNQTPTPALTLAAAPLLGVIGLIWLGRRRETRQDAAWRLTAGVLAMTIVAGFSGVRMCGYADWIGTAALSAAAADAADLIVRRYRRDRLITLIIAGLVVMPVSISAAAIAVDNAVTRLTQKGPQKATPRKPADHCFETAPYRALAAAGPPGLVLSEIDLGPDVLANTPDSVLAAPYHRMSWGMLAARGVMSADADKGAAEAKARALGVSYVLECANHANHADRTGMAANALQKRLDKGGPPPAWLEPADPKTSVLQVFRVRLSAPSKPPSAAGAP